MEETVHYWGGHGKALCGVNVWDRLNVICTLKLTLKKKEVTCDTCKTLM